MNIVDKKLSFRGSLTPLDKTKIEKFILHHMAHPSWTLEQVHDFHLNGRGWYGIGYNFWIGFDGTVYKGRGFNVGAHALGMNSVTIGIGFQGDFRSNTMTDAQVSAAGDLIKWLKPRVNLSKSDIYGHRDVQATMCPGPYFRMEDVKNAATLRNPSMLYRVQTGAFAHEKNAKDLEARLKKQGFPTYMPSRGSDALYRVQVGAYAEKENADRMAKRLEDAGYSTYIPGGSPGIHVEISQLETLRVGDDGEYVKVLQEGLNRKGSNLEVDGLYGPKTAEAALSFLKRAGLLSDSVSSMDNVHFGPKSWAALYS